MAVEHLCQRHVLEQLDAEPEALVPPKRLDICSSARSISQRYSVSCVPSGRTRTLEATAARPSGAASESEEVAEREQELAESASR